MLWLHGQAGLTVSRSLGMVDGCPKLSLERESTFAHIGSSLASLAISSLGSFELPLSIKRLWVFANFRLRTHAPCNTSRIAIALLCHPSRCIGCDAPVQALGLLTCMQYVID